MFLTFSFLLFHTGTQFMFLISNPLNDTKIYLWFGICFGWKHSLWRKSLWWNLNNLHTDLLKKTFTVKKDG